MGNIKDTFFFPHDFGARNDPKLLSLMETHGVAGIGVFWCIIEQIYEQGGMLPLSSCKSIAFALHVDGGVVEDVVLNHGLFQNDGETFWSESVNNRLDRRKDIAEKRKAAAEKRWQSTPKKGDENKSNANAQNNNANAMLCNAIKEKERKEKENINIESNKLDSSENDFSGDSDSSIDNSSIGDDLGGDATRNDTDTQTEQENPPQGKKEGKKIDFKAIVEMYHTNCPSFPRIIKMSDVRKQKIRIRLEEMKFDLELLENIFKSMEKSKFLRGDNKNGWKANFDWVFDNPKNWVKIAEGNYNDKELAGSTKNVNDIWDNQ